MPAITFEFLSWCDFVSFLQYVKFFPEVAKHEAVMDVFLPLKD